MSTEIPARDIVAMLTWIATNAPERLDAVLGMVIDEAQERAKDNLREEGG